MQTLINEQLTESINKIKYESITAQDQLSIHILQFCVIRFNNISFSITGEKICNQMQLTFLSWYTAATMFKTVPVWELYV